MLFSRIAVVAAHLALLCSFSHASNEISRRLQAVSNRGRNSPRAISSLSSSDHAPGSFMIQMPFTVVSDKTKLSQKIEDRTTPVIEITKPSAPTLMSLGENEEKINFYTIKCREGIVCSSIIPAQVVPREPTSKKPVNVEEVKRYLKSLNLENGFGFTNPENKPDIAASYFEDDKNNRISKQVSFRDFRDYENFWPGSHLRPKGHSYSENGEKRSHLKSSLDDHYYHDPGMFTGLNKELPSRLHIFAPVNIFPGRPISQGRKFLSQIPSPVFSNALEWPYASVDDITKGVTSNSKTEVSHSITVDQGSKGHHQNSKRKYFPNEEKKDGWSRFSTSTVAQLNKKTGDWYKISSSSSKLDETSAPYRPPVYHPENVNTKRPYLNLLPPSSGQDSTYKHTSTSLTVLGVTESNTPTSPVGPGITPSGDDYLSSFPSSPWSSSTVHSIDPRPANNSQNKQKPLQPISASTHGVYTRGLVFKI